MRRWLSFLPVLAGTLMILAVVLTVGRPVVFPDTDDYFAHGKNAAYEIGYALHLKARPKPPTDPDEIADAKQVVADEHMSHPVMKARSPIYGLFLYVSQRIGTLWLTTAIQALISAWVIWLLWRTAAPRAPLWSAYAVQAAAAFGSTLPFFADFAMPDIFAGCSAIAAALLTLGWSRLNAWERAGLGLLLCFAAMIHGSHSLIAVAVLASGLLAGWLMKAPRRDMGLAAATILGAIVAAVAINGLYWKAVEYKTGDTPGRPPFLAMRLIADGPGRNYLRASCAKGATWELCKFKDLPLNNSDRMMWSDRPAEGVFNMGGYAQRMLLEKQETSFVLKVLAYDPWGVLRASMLNWGKQLIEVFIDDPLLDPHYYLANPYWKTTNLPWLIDHDHGCGPDHHGCKPRLSSTQSWWLHNALAILAVLAFTARFALPDARRWIAARRFSLEDRTTLSIALAALVLIAFIANAMICGVLSGPFPRYGARVAWLLTVAAACALAGALPERVSDESRTPAWLSRLIAPVLALPPIRWGLARFEPSMLRFGMVGFAGFAIDRLLLQGAISILGMNAFTGRLLSFSLAVVATWLLNRSFTFRHDHHHAPLKQAMIYVAVQVAGGILNVGVYEVAIWLLPALKAHLLIPLALGSAAGLCVTYAGSKRFAFRRASPETAA